MAQKAKKTKKSANVYTATDNYKTFMSNKGLLTAEQHEDLLLGKSVELTGVSEKQMQYLIANNLIEKGE